MSDTKRRIDLKSHLPALFVRLGGKIGLHATRSSARQLGLDLREWRIIQVVGAHSRSKILDIADIMGMDRGGTSRSVAKLEERGYLERHHDPSDRRLSYINLTEAGWAIHEKITKFAIAREQRLLRQFSPEESELLRTLLNTLVAEADEMIAEGWVP